MPRPNQPSETILRIGARSQNGGSGVALMTPTGNQSDEIYSFGAFQLSRAKRILVADGEHVQLGGRALEILLVLVERAGDVVTKKELMEAAWPHIFVDESNLRVTVASLRKALGDRQDGARYIVNIAGHGYSFAMPVSRSGGSTDFAQSDERRRRTVALAKGRIVGRDSVVETLTDLLASRRLVTVLGPGGVGKSTVAFAVRDKVDAGSGRTCVVELASITDASQLPFSLATALGLSLVVRDQVNSLISFLSSERVLIVLDNCEHVIEAVAPLVERIMRETSDVTILATSREAILVDDEWIYRLSGLDAPGDIADVTASVALSYPAVQLFVQRATANSRALDLDDAAIAAVADICRRLDGLPLAIELVAARVDLFGVRALANDLQERLMLIARKSRTALPRQQSLRGALDWSYDLLSELEKLVFRRFSAFKGPFSLEAATEVAADMQAPVDVVLDCVESLTAKSLVAMDVGGATIRYRLLHVTRTYAAEKLLESGEAHALASRHAEHYRSLLAAAELKWETMSRSEWLAEYSYAIDDVRAALDWAFSEYGDSETGAALTIASLPFAFQISLIDEFRKRAEVALGKLSGVQPPNELAELRLLSALAVLSLNASVDPKEMDAIFHRVAALSDKVGFAKCRLEPLLALALFRVERGDLSGSLEIVTLLSDSAQNAKDPLATLLAERVAAQVHHFAGDHMQARILAERVLSHPAKVIPLAYSQASIDRRVSMRIILARILWIEGQPDQAVELMNECTAIARSDGPFTLTFALALGACPIALWTGNDDAARSHVDELLQYSRRYALERWRRLGECYLSILNRRKRGGLQTLQAEPASRLQLELLTTIDQKMIGSELATRASSGLCGWCNPEILRAAGEMRLTEGGPDAHFEAERLFLEAVTSARQQNALSWELRAATSLAKLRHSQNRSGEGYTILHAPLSRFTEGHETADVRRGVLLLEEITKSL
jgi:predicted ATPase/DNA-binding winged helix-turn-helix (wHTH) protein